MYMYLMQIVVYVTTTILGCFKGNTEAEVSSELTEYIVSFQYRLQLQVFPPVSLRQGLSIKLKHIIIKNTQEVKDDNVPSKQNFIPNSVIASHHMVVLTVFVSDV